MIGRASTSGMLWIIWSPRDRRHRTAYAPSESDRFYHDPFESGVRSTVGRTIIRIRSAIALLDFSAGADTVRIASRNPALPGRCPLAGRFHGCSILMLPIHVTRLSSKIDSRSI